MQQHSQTATLASASIRNRRSSAEVLVGRLLWASLFLVLVTIGAL